MRVTHDLNWDEFQRAALAELGLRPYRLAGADAEAGAGIHAGVESARPPTPAIDVAPALYEALLRAAGPGRARVRGLPGLDALRGNPGAKRALWPRLRRLRAEGA